MSQFTTDRKPVQICMLEVVTSTVWLYIDHQNDLVENVNAFVKWV